MVNNGIFINKRVGATVCFSAALILFVAFSLKASAAEAPAAPAQQEAKKEEAEKPAIQALNALPTVKIVTEDGAEPTCEIIYPPKEELPGASITNNAYIKGSVTVNGIAGAPSGAAMKVKVRGNTSAVGSKRSYKIKLDEAADMLGRGAGHADKEWVLLKSGENLKTYTGMEASRLLGLAWTPELRFVELEMNGKAKGIYILIESVKVSPSRLNISDSGYLFEEDAYWWNEDGNYFKTAAQPEFFGYTWKAPKDALPTSAAIVRLKNKLQTVETMINSGDKRVWSHIDAGSFASWLIVRDIMGQGDPAGSNIYFFMRSSQAKVEMGPMWDFDSDFEFTENWSAQHTADFLPFKKLLQDKTFTDAYAAKWVSVVGTLESSLGKSLDGLNAAQGKAIENSRAKDRNVWGRGVKTLAAETAEIKAYFRKQLPWINARVGEMINPPAPAPAQEDQTAGQTETAQ